MNRRTVLSLPLAALAGSAQTRSAPSLRVLASPYFQTGGLYAAEEAGYLAQEGLRLDIQQSESTRTAMPILAGGQADIAFFAISPALINAIAQGAKMALVAGRHFFSSRCTDTHRLFGSRQAFPKGFTSLTQMKEVRVVCPVRAAAEKLINTRFLNAVNHA